MSTADRPKPRASIAVPADVVATLAALTDALGGEVVLVGGWAVRCRLQMARSDSRPTEDLDVLVQAEARPARAALDAISAVQGDQAHPCRLEGLPLLVDVLTDNVPGGIAQAHPGRLDERIEDPDGLNLLIPPFGALLARSAERIRLVSLDESSQVVVLLPHAGALFAAKVANVALDFRVPEKRASDGEDIVRLTQAFGNLAILADLETATAEERADLHHHLSQLGAGGIGGQARAAGMAYDERRLLLSIERLTAGVAS